MKNLNLSYLGAIYKSSRLAAQITQETLAEKIGVTARYIMALENEGKNPSLENFIKLARTLSISADALIYPETQSADTETEQLIRMIQMLDDRDKSIIKVTVQEMLNNRKSLF